METFAALLALCVGKSSVDSPHKDQWRRALMFSLICAWTNGWANNRDVGDLRRRRAHHDVTVMWRNSHMGSSNTDLRFCQTPFLSLCPIPCSIKVVWILTRCHIQMTRIGMKIIYILNYSYILGSIQFSMINHNTVKTVTYQLRTLISWSFGWYPSCCSSCCTDTGKVPP